MWTVTTLAAHVEQRFTDSEKAVAAALAAAEKAVNAALTAADRAVAKAETASEKRFEALNELRGMVTDRDQAFASAEKVDGLAIRIDDRLKALENWRSKSTGAAVVVSLFAGVVGAAIARAFGS